MRIEDSVFLITGGGSGLGLASARELVAQGGRVLLLDINAEAGAKAAAELGERARFLRADISSEARTPRMARTTRSRISRFPARVPVGSGGFLGAVFARRSPGARAGWS